MKLGLLLLLLLPIVYSQSDYTWLAVSDWVPVNECSAECGLDDRSETRIVECKDKNDNIVADSYCDSIVKPEIHRVCPATENCVNYICRDNWIMYERNCYFVEDQFLDMLTADSNCDEISDGSHLVSFDDADEITFVTTIAGSYAYWIGLHDSHSESHFVWTDGNQSTYRNWNGGEPNNAGNTEDCVEIY
eukprot:UN30537